MGGYTELGKPESLDRFEQIRQEVGRLAMHGADPYLRAWYKAFDLELSVNPELCEVVHEAIDIIDSRHDEPRPLTEIAYYLQKSHQALEQRHNPAGYPDGLDSVEAVQPTLGRIVEDEDYQLDYLMNMRWLIATTKADRAKLLKAALLLSGKEGPLDIADFGCGLNHTLKKLELSNGGDMSFSRTSVRRWDPARQQLAASPAHSRRFNQLVRNTKLPINKAVGIDVINYDADPQLWFWAFSNSLQPGEYRDDNKRLEFEKLLDAAPSNITWHFDDVSSPSFVPRLGQERPNERYDAINISTMLYGLSKTERAATIMNARSLLKQGGLIVISDFVDINHKGQFEFYDQWEPWTYNVFVGDGLEWKKYFSADGGRVKQLKLEPAIGELTVARELGLFPDKLAAA